MNKTLTRLFTIALLMMVSMGVRAEIKIDLGGKDNKGVYEGGTVTAKQSEAKDGKVTVTLTFTPDKNYSITRKDVLLAYTAPTNTSGNTRADNPTLGETFNPSGSDDVFAYPKSATYTVTVDANLGLSVQKVEFLPMGRKAVDANNLFYIRANANNAFYLCPAIGCYYGNNVDQPHLTTFKTSGDQNSIWIKEPVENETDTYYIIHYKTGRYLKSNENFKSSDGKSNRKAVHLEVKPETLTDDFKFLIKDNSGSYQIYPKVYYTPASGMSFNPTSGHKECYAPADGGVQGMIGLFDKGDAGSKWKINSVPSESIPCATPIIKYDGDNINISYPYTDETDLTIYYTTDGTQPTTSSSSSSSTSFNIPSSGVVKVRAIATKTGLLNSDEAVLWGSARPFLIQSKECEDYYLVPSGNGKNVTTSSLPGTSMQWTLQNAGASTGGVQYYYVVNSNGKLINYNLENYTLPLNTELADANKFCVVENGYNTGKFFLIPVSNLSRCLFKNNGNVDPSVSKAETLKDWGSQSGRDQWTLKVCNVGADQKSLFSAPPFSVSDADEAHYYLIQSLGNSGYYIIPPSATDGFVQTSNSSSNYSDAPWVFKKAAEDNWLTYYYIINAATGQFMHFNLNDKLTGEGTNVVSMKDISEKSAANEDKFQYVMVPSTTTGACYIVPKGYSYADDNHINFKDNKYYGLWENSGDALKILWSRSSTANHVKWTFSEKPSLSFYIDPDITQDENGYVTISHLVNACDFYYTTDGTTTPVVPADGSDPVAPTYKYSGPFLPPLGASKIIAKAAIKGDHSITSNPVELEFSALAQPTITFDNATSTVTITSLPGATIYYAYGSTDPADPTVDDGVTHGDSPVTFTVSEKTYIKALAVKGGFTTSAVQSATIDKVAAPVTDTTSDGKVKLTSTTPSVTIYYEIGEDESSVATPTMSSTRYTGPLQNVSGKVIKAIAVKDGWITSDVGGSNGIITLQCAMPVIRRGTGNTFTISSSFPAEGVIIYYTTGSGDPTTLYEGPVSISRYPVTVKAIATADNYSNSSLAEVTIIEDLVQDGDYYLISSAGDFEKFVSKASTADGAGYKYKVTDDFTYSSTFEITQPFTGTFEGTAKEDGAFCVISGLRKPLFSSTSDAVIKNVILQDVQISESGNVGAIAREAEGYTRIYNCGILPSSNKYENESSYVSSSDGYCGGLVGWLKDDSRVINCFSYANITGGTTVAGIVGYNNFASTTKVTGEKYTELKTAIVNCMFYGNITGGSTKYPVYGGEKILNNTATGINNYDFYRAEANLGLADNSHYNCSWPAKEEYLTKYEYYRYLLNSNRELCGWWVGAPSAPSEMSTTDVQDVPKDASLIAKWVLDPSIAPYPILKAPGKYYSAINQDPDNRINPVSKTWESRQTSENTITTKAAPDTEGQKLGSITVTINKGGSLSGSASKSITITAMDIENNDFCYGKIQLPYYNSIFGDPSVEITGTTEAEKKSQWASRYGGNYGDKVVVGWEITSVTGGTEGTLVKHWQDGYNFADRDCTNKDKERIFAQGGYYYVPNGVTAITITAKWADATYLDNNDNYYDRISVSSVSGSTANATLSPFAPAGTRSTTLGNGKTVKKGAILSNLLSGDVYEKAIVLVGNNQNFTGNKDYGNMNNGFTVMSADFNLDEEPDYCLVWQLGTGTNRQSICPIRFDFLPVIEMGMAMKEDGSTQYYSLGCYLPLGHFEVTETSLIHFGQFEFGKKDRTKDAPLILNGGIYDQYCKGTKAQTTAEDHIDYVILGGNVYMPSFSPGAHVNSGAKYPTRHCAVNVLGGRINNLYLTGNFNNGVTPNTDNPHCYIDGGNFKQVAAAAKEGINGDVYFKINHSVIEEFYGGSTLADKLVTGNINVTVDNSKITKYCGGPKFGNMASGKTVTTNATGTTFGVYYGGGNGGTSYVQYLSTDATVADVTSGSYSWTQTGDITKYGNIDSYTPGSYRSGTGNKNYMANYEMEIVNTSTGTDQKKSVFRTYFYAAQFSATDTGPITNNLTNCKVLTSFYGGGNLGGVIGDVTSTLTDTEVLGSAFGAGYSASVPEVTIYNKDKTAPTLNVYTGIITPTPDPDPKSTHETYTWCYKNKTTNVVIPSGVVIPDDVDTGNPTFEYDGKKYFYTEESLENLGTVTGKATLYINGTTTVAHSVYGGGEESGVGDGTEGDGTEVNITSGTIGTEGQGGVEYGNVYGGGKGKEKDKVAGYVKGNSTVNISQAENMTTRIYHNVYGGGAYGSVGNFTYDATTGMPTALATANTGACTVTITGGTFGSNGHENGMVFGSSRGDVATPEGDPAVDPNDRMAWVYSTHVTIGDTNAATSPIVKGSVYGSGENGHTFQNTIVDIKKGIVGITDTNIDGGAAYVYRGNVYGGGCGTDKYDSNSDGIKDKYNPLAGIVQGTTTINITGGQVVHNVYGAGAMGSVGGGAEANSGKTTINITGGRIGYDGDGNGHIFGAARGEYGVSTAASGLANVRETAVNINYTKTPTADNDGKTAQLIAGSVFGGGEAGTVKESVAVNMTGGLILKDLYGGGALADTQTSNWDAAANSGAGGWAADKTSASTTTTVRLTGGNILGEAYGGGLGETGKPAYVYGDVLLDLNGTTTSGEEGAAIATTARGCAVNQVFGCNNAAGTPMGKVLVHVYATQNKTKSQIGNTDGETPVTDAKVKGSYDVTAVYGGGNLAAYEPAGGKNTTYSTKVIIDGCGLTSIKQVYGGGNAACTPATNVTVNGTYEIDELFGGGNGLDKILINGVEMPNPGANVGYKNYSEYYQEDGQWKVRDKSDADTKEERTGSSYVYGTGKAAVNIYGGKVNHVFGGSNTKGNVRQTAVTLLDEGGACEFCVDEAYGGGKSAEMDAEAQLLMACIPGLQTVYGGAEAADVRGNVTLNITNGTFDRVFGGNNKSGTIGGDIQINIEETGCKPIVIGELYGGGNLAGYSIYGFKQVTEGEGSSATTKWVPIERADDSEALTGDNVHKSPVVNVKSFTSIGAIYGGGYGTSAVMVGSPTVNINEVVGSPTTTPTTGDFDENKNYKGKELNIDDHKITLPSHQNGKIGAIGQVFGGGNAAKVIGDTHVNVGTLGTIDFVTKASGETVPQTGVPVVGVDIRGNVYGGGNNADVTGNTNVVIGKKAE